MLSSISESFLQCLGHRVSVMDSESDLHVPVVHEQALSRAQYVINERGLERNSWLRYYGPLLQVIV